VTSFDPPNGETIMSASNNDPWGTVLAQRHGKKLKPTTAAAEPTSKKPDEGAIRERVAVEVAQRAADIQAACAIGNISAEQTQRYLSSGQSVGDVLTDILAHQPRRGVQHGARGGA
jgi:hypothetical protein